MRNRRAVDWMDGDDPVRVERIPVPTIPLEDLQVFAIQSQREIFATAHDLARRAPAGMAWRWAEWVKRQSEFVDLFGEP